MSHLHADLSMEMERSPFGYAGTRHYQILETFKDTFVTRLGELHRIIKFDGVPTSTSIRAVVERALAAFRQPPLSAGLPADDPVVILKPQNGGTDVPCAPASQATALGGLCPFRGCPHDVAFRVLS